MCSMRHVDAASTIHPAPWRGDPWRRRGTLRPPQTASRVLRPGALDGRDVAHKGAVLALANLAARTARIEAESLI